MGNYTTWCAIVRLAIHPTTKKSQRIHDKLIILVYNYTNIVRYYIFIYSDTKKNTYYI